MELVKTVRDSAMKIVVRIADIVGLVKRFEESRAQAMRVVVQEAHVSTRTDPSREFRLV